MNERAKKIIRGALAAVLMCGGCAGSGCAASLPFSAETDFDTAYTVTAQIICGELEAVAEVTRSGGGRWDFSFTEPQELMGITISLDEDGYTASLGGLSFSAEDNPVYSTVPDIISAAVDSLSDVPSESISEQDGVLTIDTEYDGRRVTVTAASDSGELISLKCPYHKLAVYFSEQNAVLETEECGLVED